MKTPTTNEIFTNPEEYTEAKGSVYVMLRKIDQECMLNEYNYEEARKYLTDYMKRNHKNFNHNQIEYCIDAAMSIAIG